MWMIGRVAGVTDPIPFEAGAARAFETAIAWNVGDDPDEPAVQVHRLDAHTFLIRQSLRSSHEAPFLALLFGNERALLLDTGATADPESWPIRRVADDLIDSWLSAHPRDGYHLVVAHTHAHGDHCGGDSQFSDRPDTTVVGVEVEAVQGFFGLADWPGGSATLGLGGRRVAVLPSPGHHETALSLLDFYTGILFTGDTVYPGRLYVRDMGAFLDSMDTLVELADSGEVSHVFGCHIEIDRNGREYPLGARRHPLEGSPFLPPDRLREVRDAARGIAEAPGVHRFDGFTIYHGNRVRDQLALVARSLWAWLRRD